MTSLKYKDKDGFWQELQVGTNVVANPIIAGTESELTGLQVGDAKYKMPAGGGKLYLNSVTLTHTNFIATIQIIWNEPFSTFSDLIDFFTDRSGIVGKYTGPFGDAPCAISIDSSRTRIYGTSALGSSVSSINDSVENTTITFSNASTEL